MTLACAENCDRGFGLTRLTRSTLSNGTLVGFAQFGSCNNMSRRSRSPTIKSEDSSTFAVHISGRPMAFRLPGQLEFPLSPAVGQQMSFTNTWRGVLILEGIAMGDGELQHELYVTAAETGGERYCTTLIGLILRDSLDTQSLRTVAAILHREDHSRRRHAARCQRMASYCSTHHGHVHA
jgi:hypothetical protein